jgi:hypothetical protein
MPRLSLARSLPADIGGPKHVCRTMGASYVCRRGMGLTGMSQRVAAAMHPAPADCVR